MNDEQIAYVKEQLHAGFSEDTIAQTLRDAGYNDALITELFKAAKQSPPIAPASPPKTKTKVETVSGAAIHNEDVYGDDGSKKNHIKKLLLVIVLFLALGGVAIGGYLGYKTFFANGL